MAVRWPGSLERLRQEIERLPRLTDGSIPLQPDLIDRLLLHVDTLVCGLDSLSGAFISTGPDFTIHSWNRAAEAMYGWPAEAAVGRVMDELVPTQYPATTRQAVIQEVWERGFWTGEALQQRKDGSTLTVLMTLSSVADNYGKPAALAALCQEVTVPRQPAGAFPLSEEAFFKAFEASPDAQVISRLADGLIQAVNGSFERLFGYRREEAIGKTSLSLNMYANPADRQAIIRRLAEEESVQDLEVAIHARSGEIRKASLSAVRLTVVGEAQMFTIIKDITESKRAVTETLQAQARLEVQRRLIEQREQERLQIARDLHDGPLQNLSLLSFELSAAAQMTRDKRLEQTIQTAIETVREQIQELRQFTTELRPPLLVKFGLTKAIQAHVQSLQDKNPGLQLHLDLDPEKAPLPELVRLTLYRIYQEATTNVLKHARASQVWIRLGMANHHVTLQIRDDGTGFSLPDQWLELARQGHLGLVGMQERAEAVGGALTIESRPGQGTTVLVQVPAVDPHDGKDDIIPAGGT